jgi:hypothetical protein
MRVTLSDGRDFDDVDVPTAVAISQQADITQTRSKGRQAASKPLIFLETPRFASRYDSLPSIHHKLAVDDAIRTFVQVVRLQEGQWQRKYKRMKGVAEPTHEIRVTDSDRVLVHHKDQVFTYVDVSVPGIGHDVTGEYAALSDRERAQNQQKIASARRQFTGALDPVVLREVEGRLADLPSIEADPHEWVEVVDPEQDEAVWGCLTAMDRWSPGDPPVIQWVLGGAGTGKTVVLQHLLRYCQVLYGGQAVHWISPPSVRSFLKACGVELPGASDIGPGDVVLLDDPVSALQIEHVTDLALQGGARCVIAAFDPLQFVSAWKARYLTTLGEKLQPDEQALRTCHRQHGTVGREARHVSDAIYRGCSKFIRKEKIEAFNEELDPYLDLCVRRVLDRDDLGIVRVHDSSFQARWRQEVKRLQARPDLWVRKGWPAVAVVYEESLAPKLTTTLKNQLPTKKLVSLEDAPQKIRGQEFQEVWILLDRKTHQKIEHGEHGLSTRAFETLTNLHLAYSRAKDAVVTFVI